MSKELISENNNFEVELVSLGYRSKRLKSLKIDGKTGAITLTGAVTINGSDLSKVTGAVTAAGKIAPAALAPANFHSFCTLGHNGAGNIAAVGAKVGDKVIMIADVTTHTSQAAHFESTVTVADQIQQLNTDLSASTLVILVLAQS